MLTSASRYAVVVLALFAVAASALRDAHLEQFIGGWRGPAQRFADCANQTTPTVEDTYLIWTISNENNLEFVYTRAGAGRVLGSTVVADIQNAVVIKGRMDSYDNSTGLGNFTNLWPTGSPLGCLRFVSQAGGGGHKRHAGPHYLEVQLALGGWCGSVPAPPQVSYPACDAANTTAFHFVNLTLDRMPCSTATCGALVGQFSGVAIVRQDIQPIYTCASDISLSGSSFSGVEANGRVFASAFLNAPIASLAQSIPMVIRSYDNQTGALMVTSFYSITQCISLNVSLLNQGNFYGALSTAGTAQTFATCLLPGQPVADCTTSLWNFQKSTPAPPTAPPKATPVAPKAPGAAPVAGGSVLEIVVAYLTIAVVAVALLVLQ